MDNEKGIYIGLGEDVDIIIKTMLRFNIDLNVLAEDDSLVFANIPALDLDEIKQLLANVGEETKRLVIDPISALVFKYSDMALRQKVRELIDIIRKKEITTIITTEVPEGSNATSRFGVEDFYQANGTALMAWLARNHHPAFLHLSARGLIPQGLWCLQWPLCGVW